MAGCELSEARKSVWRRRPLSGGRRRAGSARGRLPLPDPQPGWFWGGMDDLSAPKALSYLGRRSRGQPHRAHLRASYLTECSMSGAGGRVRLRGWADEALAAPVLRHAGRRAHQWPSPFQGLSLQRLPSASYRRCTKQMRVRASPE